MISLPVLSLASFSLSSTQEKSDSSTIVTHVGTFRGRTCGRLLRIEDDSIAQQLCPKVLVRLELLQVVNVVVKGAAGHVRMCQGGVLATRGKREQIPGCVRPQCDPIRTLPRWRKTPWYTMSSGAGLWKTVHGKRLESALLETTLERASLVGEHSSIGAFEHGLFCLV